MRSRNEHEISTNESNQKNPIESPKHITLKFANSETTDRKKIIQERINKVRTYLSNEPKKDTPTDDPSQKIEQLKEEEEVKPFIMPSSKPVKRLFAQVEEFTKGERTKLPKTVTLEGPPGSGKTRIAKEVAKVVIKKRGKAYLYVQPASAISGIYAGDGVLYSDMLFEAMLKDAETYPVVVVIEEIDAVIPNRKNLGGGSASVDMRNTMLHVLAHIDALKNDNVMVIFTTNRLRDLDPAFKRTERMSQIITVDLPNKKKLDDGLKEYKSLKTYKQCEKTPDWLVAKMAEEKFSYGDLEFLLNEVCELVKENNRPAATEQDSYKEALAVTIARKKKVALLNEEEERRNAEWEEKMFEQGKKECIEALKLNPDADLKKIIKQREDKGLESSRLPPWEEENGAMLRCDSLFSQLVKELSIYNNIHHNPYTNSSNINTGISIANENKQLGINYQKGTQTHHHLTEEGKQLIQGKWDKIEECKKNAIYHNLSESMRKKVIEDLEMELDELCTELTILEKELGVHTSRYKAHKKTWFGTWDWKDPQIKDFVHKIEKWESQAYTLLNRLENLPRKVRRDPSDPNLENDLRMTIQEVKKIRTGLQKEIDKHSR